MNKKTVITSVSIALNIVLVGVVVVLLTEVYIVKGQSHAAKIRFERVYKMSNGLLRERIPKEVVRTDNQGYLWDQGLLDGGAVLHKFEYDVNGWQCEIGPMHPTYGPGVIFDSNGNIEIMDEKEYITNHSR